MAVTSQEWQITLTSRVLFFLLRTHHSQIVATRALRQTMLSLRGHLRDALKRQKVRLAQLIHDATLLTFLRHRTLLATISPL